MFEPSRTAALARLAAFVPTAGQHYAAGRNTDPGPTQPSAVSKLSPYLRYRLLTEREVVAAVLDRHGLAAADKFVQEVLWRTYWKGWLEMRPIVWARFIEERDRQRQAISDARAIDAAEGGTTGIAGFDDWARALVATGYLHNHARMWFASIWIFTLRLPWALGADFFLRHLIDADAASNTLSWRWVAGLQTVGKTYLATADNIARHTNGRFVPVGLAREAVALIEPPVGPAQALPDRPQPVSGARSLLLVTHEDMHPESLLFGDVPIEAAVLSYGTDLLWGDRARAFVRSATDDVGGRVRAHYGCATDPVAPLTADVLVSAAQAAGVRQIVTAYAPVGPVADALAATRPVLEEHGIALTEGRRHWDRQFWAHATRGFFPFKDKIPTLLEQMGER